MIHTVKFVLAAKKRERALKDMQQELHKMLNTWKDKGISGDCVKHYPEFARGYTTALKEILGDAE